MPEQVQDRRVQVVDVDGVDGGGVADLVGLAVADAALDAAAGHPDGEAVRVVVAAGLLAGLGDRQAAELAAPDHQRLVEQPALVEVGQQAGDRLVGLAGELLVVPLDVGVAVPGELVVHAARVDLDEADAALDQAAGRQALAGDVVATRVVDAVELS